MSSLRAQKILIWWALGFTVVYFIAMAFCLHLLPTPPATWTAAQVARYYQEHSLAVRVGAMLSAWTSAFFVPWAVVLLIQMWRHEKLREPDGVPVWTILAGFAGAIASVMIVMPPDILGAAAYAPDRAADVTAALHQFGILTWISGDQYANLLAIPIAIVCLMPNSVPHSPFPRWLGYLSILLAVGSEPAVFPFLTRTGPFAWNGVLGYWIPVLVFVVWFPPVCVLMYKSINAQMRELREQSLVSPPVAAV